MGKKVATGDLKSTDLVLPYNSSKTIEFIPFMMMSSLPESKKSKQTFL